MLDLIKAFLTAIVAVIVLRVGAEILFEVAGLF